MPLKNLDVGPNWECNLGALGGRINESLCRKLALANKRWHRIGEEGRNPVGHLGTFRNYRYVWVTKLHIFETTET